ncbi:MAG TPA: hypothetical protein VKB38_14190 [Terracidiphilus sp.]|nr:hypothetical protein [Terracidiphilus sp.]
MAMRGPQDAEIEDAGRREEQLGANGQELERKYRIALALYGVLAVVAWFTIGDDRMPLFGKMIEIRWVPIFVLAMFAFRTVMVMKADRIRRGDK